uniref:Methyltransferase FkbM family n=1 Tax=Cyanothece sp. (strain PCC 7425 / ATCC 29141) TaxID=395961 RepID=B8HNC4_CYAP4
MALSPRHLISNFAYRISLEVIIKLLPKHLQLPTYYYTLKLFDNLEPELLFLDKLISKKGKAIDIGANRGIYSYALSKLCCNVIAFEPQASIAQNLHDYAHVFGKPIEIYNCGLSDKEIDAYLDIPIIRGKLRKSLASGLARISDSDSKLRSDSTERTLIKIKKLDSYNFVDIVFIKIDVEGHEDKVIEGAKETILREKPVLLIEIEQRHHPEVCISKIFNKVESLGYQGYFLLNSTLIKVEEFSLNLHQSTDNFSDHCDRPYIQNFIFIPLGQSIS